MSVQEEKLKAIADAIRLKKRTSELIVANDFASEILSIETGGVTPSGTIEITENGTYDVTEYASANVNVASAGGGEDMLQLRVDYGENCDYLFYRYPDKPLDYISGLDTSKAKTFTYTFSYCQVKNLDLRHFNTSNVENFYWTFTGSPIENLDVSNWNTNKVTEMYQTFQNCYNLTNLNIANWDVSLLESLYSTFSGCSKLPILDLSTWKNVINITNLDSTFASCPKLVTLNLTNWDTHNVTDWDYTFNNNTVLKEILGELDMYSRTTTSDFLSGCKNIETLTLKNIRKTIKIGSGTSWGSKLSVDSLINTIKELWDYSSETTTYKLTMGSTNTAKLADIYVRLITPTAEQIEADPYIESKKPCEVCASTDEGAMLITAYAQSKNWQIS